MEKFPRRVAAGAKTSTPTPPTPTLSGTSAGGSRGGVEAPAPPPRPGDIVRHVRGEVHRQPALLGVRRSGETDDARRGCVAPEDGEAVGRGAVRVPHVVHRPEGGAHRARRRLPGERG